MKKEGRGSFIEKGATIDGVCLSVVSWYDNKIVTLPSNFVGSQPPTEVKRLSKDVKENISVACPKLVEQYNHHMGRVDLLDSMLVYYRSKVRWRKWYHRIFSHILDMTVVYGWILWRRYQNLNIALVDFELNVANLLAYAGKDPSATRKRGRSSLETIDLLKPDPKIINPMMLCAMMAQDIGLP